MTIKVQYECANCNCRMERWLGQCPECGQWNTFKKIKTFALPPKTIPVEQRFSQPICEVETPNRPRYTCGISELDRVLGGGVVHDAVLLMAGQPGAGKSTLWMQAANGYAQQGLVVHYCSGEESKTQLKARADRLNTLHPNLIVFAEQNLDFIFREVFQSEAQLVILDSLQATYPGRIEATEKEKTVTSQIVAFAKTKAVPWIVINHMTKELDLAGPKNVQHQVDGVFVLENEENSQLRVLRAQKYRDGATDEIGIFEMRKEGMVGISQPSSLLLLDRTSPHRIGSVLTVTQKGNRPVLVELQALVTPLPEGKQKGRVLSRGIESRRVELLASILCKLGWIPPDREIYVSVVGGFRVESSDADLAVITAMLSSEWNVPMDLDTLWLGEVGLSGELRGIRDIERRVMEGERLGFPRMILPQINTLSIPIKAQLIGFRGLQEVRSLILGQRSDLLA